jgi:uroporphyrinogen-III synthase
MTPPPLLPTILLTRPISHSQSFFQRLVQAEIPVKLWPLIEIQGKPFEPKVLRQNFSRYQALIFPSSSGVQFFFQGLQSLGWPLSEWFSFPVIAIGKKTAQTLKTYSSFSVTSPPLSEGTSLLESLKKQYPPESHFLLAGGTQSLLVPLLEKSAFSFDFICCYETCALAVHQRLEIETPLPVVLVFASPSAVDSYYQAPCFSQVFAFITIGNTTASALQQRSPASPIFIASEPSDEGLWDALQKCLKTDSLSL